MPHEIVLDSLASTFNPLVPHWDKPDPDICQSTYFSAQHDPQPPTEWVITEEAKTGNRRTHAATARGTTAGRLLRSEKWVADKSDALGRLWSAGVSVPRSEALGSFTQPDLSDGSGAPRSENNPARARRRDQLARRGSCGERGWRLAGELRRDRAMVATLVDVESLKGALDWLLAAVAQPQRPPMTLVAF